jgi:spore coat polysaccharide biosynthesis protein SpsF
LNTAAIIQARLGSSRLPGKSMMNICGKPILERVIDRTKIAIKNVIVATPDIEIVKFCENINVNAFLGSEEDVLDRYYQAALMYQVYNIVRITADNPLVCPDIIKKVFSYYMGNNKLDWVSNCRLKATYPIGTDTEVFTFKALEKAWKYASEDYDREHVTPYIYNHPEMFKLLCIENDTDLSHLRWTVDYPEDLEFVREIYTKLGGNFTMNDVLEYQKGGVEA